MLLTIKNITAVLNLRVVATLMLTGLGRASLLTECCAVASLRHTCIGSNDKVENMHADFHYAHSEKRRKINVGDFYRPKYEKK